MERRRILLGGTGLFLPRWAFPAARYPAADAEHALAFPRDHGAHPDFRIEWWYLTSWLALDGGQSAGLHFTFFRLRPGIAESNPSRFAPNQLLFAHAALADPRHGRLRMAQRAARARPWPGLAGTAFDTQETRLALRDWTFVRAPDGRYAVRAATPEFRFALTATPTQPVLLQGQAGWSRKGPGAGQASYYYSQPQLDVAGEIDVGGRTQRVTGRAWLDHEWASTLLDPRAVGWDWTGINGDDGSALMAFRVRDAEDGTLWASAMERDASGRHRLHGPEQVRFAPLRQWRSPRTEAEYPVETTLAIGARRIHLAPLMDDQELDARRSVGNVYWEGAVTATENGTRQGRGYLELTGYGGKIRM